ncbi:MAG: glycosyltransferase family 39 protein [Chloroflexi bacterium]|nr:glycosyltransferase family 39 protein [Chloroflexota bacterium]
MGHSPTPGSLRLPLLVALLLSALALRLYGIDWDQGQFFHPDERFLIQFKLQEVQWPRDWSALLDPARSPWNPHWFAYGSFPLYLLKLLSWVAGTVAPGFTPDHARFLGRGLSAVADAGTVLLLYLLGARLYGRRTGLLAAAFTTFAVLHIQLSHFATFDVLLTATLLLVLLGAALVMEQGSYRGSLLAGLGLGLGLATKVSVAPILLPILLAHALYAWFPPSTLRQAQDTALRPFDKLRTPQAQDTAGSGHRPSTGSGHRNGPRLARALADPARLRRALVGLGLASGVAAVAFLLAQPYAILDWSVFLRDVREQSEMVLRLRDYPYTRQYAGTAPYLYPLEQLATWGLGWPLGLVVYLGLGFSILRGWLYRDRRDLLLLSWVLPYLLLTGAFPVKFLRYLLPVTPLLLLMGARLLLSLRDWAAPRRGSLAPPGNRWFTAARHFRMGVAPTSALALGQGSTARARLWRNLLPYAPELLIGLVLGTTVWYALAFTNIYRQDHPALRLSRWINDNVPRGQLILKEHWEEGVPDLGQYRVEELALYEPDDSQKTARLAEQLSRADYLVFYSNRLYGTIPRLPERYPVSSRYYQLLFSGRLGYQLVHSTEAYPSFLGVTWRDDTFRRPGLPAPGGAQSGNTGLALEPGAADESFTVYDHPKTLLFKKAQPLSAEELARLLQPALRVGSGEAGLMLSPPDLAAQQAGGAWAELFPKDSLARQAPWLMWLLALEALGLLTLPLAFGLFSSFPDRGYLVAKGLGLLLVGYVTWLLASLHLLPFARGTAILAMAALLAAAFAATVRQQAALKRFLADRWRYLLALEALFLLAFAGFLLVRATNPDLWHPWRGGEKPMDFAYLNALVKSTTMPPYDPWFSGGYINYYYYGHFLVALLIKLTGVVPEVAYNLAVPTLFALLVGGLFSLGSALAAGAGAGTQATASPGGAPGPAVVLGGVAAVILVALVGNLDGAGQLLEALQRASAVNLPSTLPGLSGLAGSVAGVYRVTLEGAAVPPFDYWRSSRMMPPTISITEFPLFTFLFADLHAHLISLPFSVLALALAAQLALGDRQAPGLGKRLAYLAALGLVVGAIRWVNSWDYPTLLLVSVIGVAIMELRRSRRLDRWLLARVIGQGLLLLALSMLLFLPLQASYRLFYAGVTPSPETTPLHQYLLVHGLFLAILLGFVASEGWQRFHRLGLLRLLALLTRRWPAAHRAWALSRALARRSDPASGLAATYLSSVLAVAVLLAAAGLSTLAFLAAFLGLLAPVLVAEALSPEQRRPGHLFALSLTAIATLLGVTVEVFTLQGDIQRMNTVFKFYLQAWVLYGVAAAYALWWVLARPATARGPGTLPRFWSVGRPDRLWALAVATLFLASLVYPLAATPVRVADRFLALPPTLDGMAYMSQAEYRDEGRLVPLQWDYEAIQWLREKVPGSPVVLEAVTPIYRWGSRVSIYTGLPTVLGWDWHQSQQRWGYREEIEVRKQDVAAIYSTPSEARALELLRQYGVRYVYVGPVERLYYPDVGLSKFAAMAQRGHLRQVYTNPGVTVYAVEG